MLYEYTAHVVSVYDGDTFHADVDLGFYTWLHKQPFRMFGINTPEMTAADPLIRAKAVAARDALRGMILGQKVRIQSHKDAREKYGRWLGDVFIPAPPADNSVNVLIPAPTGDGWVNVNQALVQQGHAVVYLP